MADAPTTSVTINRDLLLEPLNAPTHPHNFLDKFPDEVYNKSVDSVLVKFLNALLGPSGAGWITKNYLDVRLMFEESGLELDQLEKFYGNPLRFGRLALETYDYETTGDLQRSAWDEVKVKDESYRNRVIDFFHAARLGGTPDGITLAARSGLGYGVKVVENYKYLFDQQSDSVIGIDNFGTTAGSYQFNTEEFVIIPDQEYSQSSVKKVKFKTLPVSGTFTFKYKDKITNTNYKIPTGTELLSPITWSTGSGWTNYGTNTYIHSSGANTLTNFTPDANTYYRVVWTIFGRTAGSIEIKLGNQSVTDSSTISGQSDIKTSTNTSVFTVTPTTDFDGTVKFSVYKLLDYNLNSSSTAYDVTIALSSLPNIGANNVFVSGNFTNGFTIQFIGQLANQEVGELSVNSQLIDSTNSIVETSVTTLSSNTITNESVFVTDSDKKNLTTAVDQIKPVNTYPSYKLGRSKLNNQTINSSSNSSNYYEVIRCVTGATNIAWPEVDSVYWIEKGVEKQAPRIQNDLQYHYQNFHKPANIYSYSSSAVADKDYTTNSYATVITNTANISRHTGKFNSAYETKLNINGSNLKSYENKLALPTFSEPPLVTTQANYSGIQFINGIYPMGDKMQSVIDTITNYTQSSDFWASTERSSGSDYLEIDLGSPKAINFLTFEIVQSPIDIEISYDVISNGQTREFVPVTPEEMFSFDSTIDLDNSLNQSYWQYLTYHFTNDYKEIPFARFLRIKFTRKTGGSYRFLPYKSDGTDNEWPILIRNLRVGRNV